MISGKSVLVLDDEALLRKGLCRFLEDQGAETWPAASLDEARNLLAGQSFDYALLDINLPDGNSLDLFAEPGFPETTIVVVMTGQGGIASAIKAIKAGARDYLSKPVEPEALPHLFQRLAREDSRQRIDQFQREDKSRQHSSLFLGRRLEAIQHQLDKILKADQRLANALPPVLIEGETGTGKSTLARWLHQNGPRAAADFIEINCSTLPESMAESELFGHEKGAFTDARSERMGLFEAASGGTLFLDEIASLPLALQAKVLTAIEDRRIRRLGGNRYREIDVRLITASLVPLRDLVQQGNFREDLFHRLHLLTLQIPPLREFPEDLPELADHILLGLRKRYHQPGLQLTPTAKQHLLAYSWPGNVRELMHELEREIVFADDHRIELANLPDAPAAASQPDAPAPESVPRQEAAAHPAPDGRQPILNPLWQLPDQPFDFEKELHHLTLEVIRQALRTEKDNVSAAARRLGVPRDFIRYRIKS